MIGLIFLSFVFTKTSKGCLEYLMRLLIICRLTSLIYLVLDSRILTIESKRRSIYFLSLNSYLVSMRLMPFKLNRLILLLLLSMYLISSTINPRAICSYFRQFSRIDSSLLRGRLAEEAFSIKKPMNVLMSFSPRGYFEV